MALGKSTGNHTQSVRKRGRIEAVQGLNTEVEGHSSDVQSTPRFRKTVSLRWKILSIAIISATALILYLVLVAKELRSNVDLIEDIFESQYPIQALMQSSEHLLVLVHRNLEDAVITGDEDMIEVAEPLAIEFRRKMVNAVSLDPSYESQILNILDEFETYYSGATDLVESMLFSAAYQEPQLETGEQNTRNYQRVIQSMQIFQSERHETFANAVNNTSQQTQNLLTFGVWANLTIAFIVLILAVVIARSIVDRIHQMVATLKRIAQENDGMNVRISLDGNDEMTELAHWFNTFIGKLERVTTESTAEIKRIAYTDTLSGLPNRRMLIESIDSIIKSDCGNPVAILFMDLDNFKPINDELGHEAGDELIRQASARIQTLMDSINDQDARRRGASNTAIVGRLGGDEFMVIVPLLEEKADIESVAVDIRDSLLIPFDLSGNVVEIGVSIGISRYPHDAQSKDHLIDCADMAMYEAKGAGKNTYRFFDLTMAQTSVEANKTELALKSCVLNNELSLVYQAKFDLVSGEYTGAEALLQWQHQKHGLLEADDFMHLAEKSAVVQSIGSWVFDEVFTNIAAWLAKGIDPGRVTINLPAALIQRPGLMAEVTALSERHVVHFRYLEFAIRECSSRDHMETVMANVQNFRDSGIYISLNDYGSEHSSLQFLVNCKIDSIRLDQTLVHNINNKERCQTIVRSIIKLAETLEIQCVAKGIESYKQLHQLQQLRCQIGQGPYFAEPRQAHKFADQLVSTSHQTHTGTHR